MKLKTASRLKKLSKKQIIIILVIILLILVGVFRIASNRMADNSSVSNDVVNIKVTTAAITTLENTSPLTGRLEPIEEVTIIPKASSEVTGVYVKMGDKITKGTVLFELDQTQVATSYNQAKIGLSDAKLNYERIQELYQEGAVSLQQYEQARTQYTVAQETYTSASDGLSNYVITSPIDGYVTSINVQVGSFASPNGAAATIANIDQLEIDASLSENMINKVHVGDKVDVLVSSVSDQPFSGTVSALSPAPATGSLTYPMKVTLDNESALIKPGMFAEVTITSEKTDNVIALPSNCVLIKSGQTVVAEIENDKIIFKNVEIGVDNGQLAEIKSGVSVGDIVVVEGQYYLDENSEFSVID